MSAKDIPCRPILEFLAKQDADVMCGWHDLYPRDAYCPTVRDAIPTYQGLFPDKVVLAKMRSLIKRGLVSGCACGCRGDFQITAKGAKTL